MKHTIFHYLLTFIYLFLKSAISSVILIVLGVAGYFIFMAKRTPFDLLLGLPLMLIGSGLTFNSMLTAMYSLFSPAYNRGMCPICNHK